MNFIQQLQIWIKSKQFLSRKIAFFFILLIISINQLKAQDIDGVHSFFAGGVSMKIPKNNKLFVYGGFSPTDKVKALVVLPNVKAGKYLTLTPGYTFVNISQHNAADITEHQLQAIANVAVPITKNWTLADRNMYFHRFRKNADDLSFYRNRLGIIHQTEIFRRKASIFLHDEVYLSLNNGQFTRNRIILGGDLRLFKWLTPQVMYMYQSDKVSGSRHLGWLIFTIPLENFGVFK